MKLHFRALGDGPPLVVLHGLLGSLDNWVPLAQRWAAQFRVYLPDLRNHGQSPHSPEFNYEAMAADVVELLRAQHVPAAHLLGHSMGGKVVMRLAQLHPEVVNRLVVVDMSPREYSARFDALLAALLAVDLGRYRHRAEVDEALRAAVPDQRVRQFLLKNLGRHADGALFWKANLASLHANYAQVRAAIPTAAAVHRPALFVRGADSNYVQATDEPRIRELFPQATQATIAGAGHWVHADAPERLREVVTQFLLAER